MSDKYRGRIAPSPTGYLHVGHALTFWCAQERAQSHNGTTVLRIEDLEPQRCRAEFLQQSLDDLRWFGIHWDEGPDVGGRFAPYRQSERRARYLKGWRALRRAGLIYPCCCSRMDIQQATVAPHEEGEEPIYPGTCRPSGRGQFARGTGDLAREPGGVHWRFRVPDGEELQFCDERLGNQMAIAGRDFGDFVVWRKDDVPAYQLAVVMDDVAMQITEVVRGEDLLLSTFRQLLLYRALRKPPPRFFHTPLIRDESGKRLAKRHASLTLRELRASGVTPEELRVRFLR